MFHKSFVIVRVLVLFEFQYHDIWVHTREANEIGLTGIEKVFRMFRNKCYKFWLSHFELQAKHLNQFEKRSWKIKLRKLRKSIE